jgi:CubicO group peptidase (beta-lactamase class C family)
VHPITRAPALLDPGGGLLPTVEDLSRFCQMLLNGGELNDERELGRTTVEILSMNHAPEQALADIQANDPVLMGHGFGLASAELMDASTNGTHGTPGQFAWVGGVSTCLWVNPKESLFALLLAQRIPIDFTRWRQIVQVMYQAME